MPSSWCCRSTTVYKDIVVGLPQVQFLRFGPILRGPDPGRPDRGPSLSGEARTTGLALRHLCFGNTGRQLLPGGEGPPKQLCLRLLLVLFLLAI